MIESIDTSLIDWSRAQFAMTAMYHWIFVPLTLGLAVVMGIMETLYYKTGNEFWKKTAQFWMKLFGINFAIGVATGLILEFEFGTNWSNYSWFVGDIFGAPLAIEGILAFFMEATFIAVMFFILKLFFFPDFLGDHPTDADKGTYVGNELIQRALPEKSTDF